MRPLVGPETTVLPLLNGVDAAERVWDLLGALLFVWATLGLINLWAITPDLLVATLVFVAFGLLTRIARGFTGGLTCVLLGLVLGLAYWAKAALFPLGLVFLASAFLIAPRPVRFTRTALAAGGFAALALPLVAVLSAQKGRSTFGDSGKLNMAWFVGRQPQLLWRGPEAEHPPRLLLDEPAVYEYGDGPGGTYSPWFDPSYWQEGTRLSIGVEGQARALAASAWHLWEGVVQPLLALLVALAIVACLGAGRDARAPPRESASCARPPGADPLARSPAASRSTSRSTWRPATWRPSPRCSRRWRASPPAFPARSRDSRVARRAASCSRWPRPSPPRSLWRSARSTRARALRSPPAPASVTRAPPRPPRDSRVPPRSRVTR